MNYFRKTQPRKELLSAIIVEELAPGLTRLMNKFVFVDFLSDY